MKVIDFFKEWSNKCTVSANKSAYEGKIILLEQTIDRRSIELEEKKKNQKIKSSFICLIIALICLVPILALKGAVPTALWLVFCGSVMVAPSALEKDSKKVAEVQRLVEEIKSYKSDITKCKKEINTINLTAKEIMRTLNIIEQCGFKEMFEYEIPISKNQLIFYLENNIPLFAILELIRSGEITQTHKYRNENELKRIKDLSKGIMKKLEDDFKPKHGKKQVNTSDEIDYQETKEEKATRRRK